MEKEVSCTLRYLIDKVLVAVGEAAIESFGDVDLNIQVENVALYSSNEPVPDGECVYFCKVESLGTMEGAYKESVLICIGDEDDCAALSVPGGFNVVVIKSPCGFERVFNVVQKTIGVVRRSSLLMDCAALAHSSFESIVTIAEHMLKNPFIVVNTDYQLVGWSRSKMSNNAFYADAVNTGGISDAYLDSLINDGVLRKLAVRRSLVCMNLTDCPVVISPFRRDGVTIGYGLMVCCEAKPRQPMIQGFVDICGKISPLFPVREYVDCSKTAQYCLMLLGGACDSGVLKRYADKWQIRKCGEFVLHVISSPMLCAAPTALISKRLAKAVSADVEPFAYEDNILLVEYLKDDNVEFMVRSAGFAQFVKSNQAKSSTSAVFFDLDQVVNAYAQASEALRVGAMLSECKDGLFFNYPEDIYQYSELIQLVLIDKEFQGTHRLPITCPKLVQLLLQDKEAGTNNAKLLFSYLKQNGYIGGVSSEMYLHRNSVANRLRRISEILKVDLLEVDTRGELLFNFRVIDYALASGSTQHMEAFQGGASNALSE